LAVDIVGSKFLGFDLKEVEHLKLAAKYGLGESRISKIEIVNKALFDERRQSFSWNLLEKFPPEVKIVRGKTMCCTEGCKRNTEALLEVLSQDFKGKGSFTIFMGKGIDRADIEGANAPVHIAGDCAIGECYQELCKRLGRSKVTTSPGCNNLAANLDGMMKWLHITPLKLVPVNPIKSLKLLILAKLHGTKANIPPVIKI
ncbi:MAG TPA: hypothetical protein PLF54_10905, partial [Deltaproteobacteria bacterium]|nr:hypothetical protein [Deltaproteobacteria bacterium]